MAAARCKMKILCASMECSTFQQPNSHSRRGATPAKCMLRKAQVLARTSLAPCLEPCRTIGRFPAEPSSFTCNNIVLLAHIILKPRNVDRWVGSWSCRKLGFGILRALLVYLQTGNHVKNFETLTWLNFRIALPTTSCLNRVRQLFISVCFAIIGCFVVSEPNQYPYKSKTLMLGTLNPGRMEPDTLLIRSLDWNLVASQIRNPANTET